MSAPLNQFVSVLRLLQGAFGSYYPQLALIVVLGFFASILEGLGISAIIPLFSFVTGGAGTAADTITHIIGGIFASLGLPYTFRFLLVFVGVLFVVRILALFAIQNVTARIVFGYERDMRKRMFGATIRARWPFLSMQKVGHLDQLLITNTTNSSQFFGTFSTMVLIATKTVAYIVIALNISKIVATLSLIVGALLFVLFKPLFTINKKFSEEAEQLNRALAHFVSQHIAGMKSIKSAAVEGAVEGKISGYFERIRQVFVNMVTVRGLLEMGMQFAGLAFVGGVFVYLYRFSNFNFASFAVIVYAVNQIFGQVQAAQVQLHSLSTMIPYLSRARAYQKEAQENAESVHDAREPSLAKGIEFRKVSFSYPGRREILKDVSFRVDRGAIVAIVGPSGVGKSTVADLLLRLIEPSSGSILSDGEDIQTTSLKEWRSKVAYIPQEAFLLNDSIRNNISFYDAAMTDEMIVEAARKANIHEFIMSLPKKYETPIGDRGTLVSGGQRQRLVLARLLARKPRVLVLDEATSALDVESEQAIRRSIEQLRGETTVFIIAHGGELHRSADLSIMLEDGRVGSVEPRSS